MPLEGSITRHYGIRSGPPEFRPFERRSDSLERHDERMLVLVQREGFGLIFLVIGPNLRLVSHRERATTRRDRARRRERHHPVVRTAERDVNGLGTIRM